MKTHHPYESGYNVLPNLRKISLVDVFHRDPLLRQRCLQAKSEAIKSQTCCVRGNLGAETDSSITHWIKETYPGVLHGSTLDQVTPQMSEDVIVHRLGEETDAMVFGHVCFPSGWDPAKAIGKSFEVIHQTVPGMNLRSSRKLVESICKNGPYERFVWSVVFDDEINGHPSRDRKAFDLQHPVVFVKVERQVTVPFAKLQCALFLLQQSLISGQEIKHDALLRAIQNMSLAELRYKNLEGCQRDLCHWLEASGVSASRAPMGNER